MAPVSQKQNPIEIINNQLPGQEQEINFSPAQNVNEFGDGQHLIPSSFGAGQPEAERQAVVISVSRPGTRGRSSQKAREGSRRASRQ